MSLTTIRRGSVLRLPAPRGALYLRLAGEGKAVGPVSVVDNVATVMPTQTATMPAGRYQSEWEIGSGGSVSHVGGEPVVVKPSLATDSIHGFEPTQAERTLQAALDTLESAAGDGSISFSTSTNSFSFESRSDLLAFVARLRHEVAVERLADTLNVA